ncbi:3-oxoacyl-(acyl-carrier-protein) synthase-3 [Vibrio crassostreae]|uniref:ketoacyl-ACP synthase III family protein n=1 Tax=Vibrio crassostreae TaxID=246167 RepID=UPI00104A5C54|nr:ketoacyl-ACP synthase III family protein [Vibrio crassostreae]TCN75914.1 3-oxoacyl-[acyl-carrier-protein] synthase-3 [Vibrio crassostreae]CAK2533812.1 3-oxoacyl-(acyl-carrier-protein) synthase-3 [Vibrio crassostreae]CAK3888679.1 3-oxoacyl-(acyl-carrier-protein) synthase-3 [Vibrio crassostreae]
MKIISTGSQLSVSEHLGNVDHPNKMQLNTLKFSGYDQFWKEPGSIREMAGIAAKKALLKAGVHPEDIGFIVAGQSGVPDYIGIDLACQVGAELSCKNIRTINIVEGCNSGISVWEHAASLLEKQSIDKIGLVVVAQRISEAHQDRFGLMNAILSDGAAAAVVAPEHFEVDGSALHYLGAEDISDCRFVDMMRVEHGGGLQPYITEAFDTRRDKLGRERIADIYNFGTDDLNDFLKLRGENNVEIINKVISKSKNKVENPFLIQTLEGLQSIKNLCAELNIPIDRSNLDLLSELGHVGCADLLISLDYLMDRERIKPGDDIIMSTISTGLKWGAAIFHYQK